MSHKHKHNISGTPQKLKGLKGLHMSLNTREEVKAVVAVTPKPEVIKLFLIHQIHTIYNGSTQMDRRRQITFFRLYHTHSTSKPNSLAVVLLWLCSLVLVLSIMQCNRGGSACIVEQDLWI